VSSKVWGADWRPVKNLAAAAVVVAATAATVVIVVGAAHTVVAAAAEQQDQDDDPPAVITTETVIAHNKYLQDFFSGDLPLIPRYSAAPKRCETKIDSTHSKSYNGI